VEDSTDATYYREVAALLARRVAAQGPLARLEMFHALPVAVSQQNELVVPLPADLLWWTPTADEISQALLQGEGAPPRGRIVDRWTTHPHGGRRLARTWLHHLDGRLIRSRLLLSPAADNLHLQ
jgi:hypothetical protein